MTAYDHALAEYRARMDAQDEALRRAMEALRRLAKRFSVDVETLDDVSATTRAVERCERLAKLGPAPPWWRVFAVRRWLRAYRAIMALDISVHAEMLRSAYTDDRLRELATGPNPFIAIAKQPAGTCAPVGRWVEPVRFIGDDMEVGKPHPLLPRGAVVKSIDPRTGNVTYEVP